jgi:hypothetical protein
MEIDRSKREREEEELPPNKKMKLKWNRSTYLRDFVYNAFLDLLIAVQEDYIGIRTWVSPAQSGNTPMSRETYNFYVAKFKSFLDEVKKTRERWTVKFQNEPNDENLPALKIQMANAINELTRLRGINVRDADHMQQEVLNQYRGVTRRGAFATLGLSSPQQNPMLGGYNRKKQSLRRNGQKNCILI